MAKGKRTTAAAGPPPQRPPVAAAAAARKNEKRRKKRGASGQNLAAAGCCVFAVVLAVVLRATGRFDEAGRDARRVHHPNCADRDPRCAEWARNGDCDSDPKRVLDVCRSSCDVCDLTELRAMQARFDMGVEQEVDYEGEHGGKTYRMIDLMHNYYRTEVVPQGRYTPEVQERCRNKNESCALWAAQGQCKSNKTFMLENCAAACRGCYKLICPLDEGGPYVWGPGALDRMFKRITTEPYYVDRYFPRVHSRPADAAPNDGARAASDDGASEGGPWVVTLENFLTPEECDRLMALGHEMGFHASQTRVDRKAGGAISGLRTSSTSWCKGACSDDPVNRAVVERIANLTGVPPENQENLQLLKYEEGQYYGVHRDYMPDQRPRQQGVRILTVFLYLNDEGLEGGGTNFPLLNDLTIHPKRGQALIWPNVKNEAPNEEDKRMDHQALPVVRGVKYGSNAWLHMRDYNGARARDCL